MLAETSNLKRRRSVDSTTLVSNMANLCPGWKELNFETSSRVKEIKLNTDAVAGSSTERDVRIRMPANSLVREKTFGVENQRIRKCFWISMRCKSWTRYRATGRN